MVPRNKNRPNLPKRLIEKFWAICKQQYKKSSFVFKNPENFEKYWIKLSATIASQHGKRLMSGLQEKLHGPIRSFQPTSLISIMSITLTLMGDVGV